MDPKKIEMALDSIRRPVRYDPEGQRVYDCKNETVLQIRGWGRLQYLNLPEERQDAIGELVAKLINDA